MKILITGSSGFVGGHLITELNKQGMDCAPLDLKYGDDIRDYEQVRRIIDGLRPDRIFHLAALTFVPESFISPVRAFEINTLGSLNILEAVRSIGLKTKIHLAGTSEEYGNSVSEQGEVTEESTLKPSSPYSVAKMAMDHLGQIYSQAYGMDIVITRAFNHSGPGRSEQFAESAWAKQIVEIENGKRDILRHGNLESVRNYTDVRDIVRAYIKAIELPSGVYNICSDASATMQEILDLLILNAKVPIKTEVDPNLYRATDFSFNKPNCDKFKELTGWKPEITLEQTLEDLLDYWRRDA